MSHPQLAQRLKRGYAHVALFLGLFQGLSLGSPAMAQMPGAPLSWQILGDVTAKYPHSEYAPATLSLGSLDLWFQSQMSENWSAMGELIVMRDDSGGADSGHYMIHPARAFLNYEHSRELSFRTGLLHNPIGYYALLYPHGGRFFEPTIHRPKLAGIEEGEDILPFHMIGATVRGTLSLSESFDLMYIAGAGNGYGHGGDDNNQAKATFLQLRVLPLDLEGLSVGLSTYFDIIAKDEVVGDVHQFISALSLHYDMFPIELLVEGFMMRNATEMSLALNPSASSESDYIARATDGKQPTKKLLGGYAQLSYSWEYHALYGMIEAFKRDVGDYLFDEHTPYDEYQGFEVGHRYHFNQNVVLKSGYTYVVVDALHRFDLQLAFRL